MRHQSEVLQRVRSRLSVKRPSGYHEAVTRWQLRASRFKADVNHRIAKTTVAPGFLIGLEDLMHLRERTRTQGKHRHRKRPRAPLRNAVLCRLPIPNRRRINHPSIHPSVWMRLSPPRGAQFDDPNRPKQGRHPLVLPSTPIVGVRTVTVSTLLIRQDGIETGLWSAAPDGSDGEAKAQRVKTSWNCGGVRIQAPPLRAGSLTGLFPDWRIIYSWGSERRSNSAGQWIVIPLAAGKGTG